MGEIVNADDIPVIQELLGDILLQDYRYKKAVMCLGSGNNGKRALLNLITVFLGKENTSSVSLQDLGRDRFASVDLYGKFANIHADIEMRKNERPIKTGDFKKLTGGDHIRGQKKHQKSFYFYNHAKLIFAANELPKTADLTNAFWSRWNLIDFPNVFEGENADREIIEKITTPDELSGLLNWALEGYARLESQHGYTETKSHDQKRDQWLMMSDGLGAFLTRHFTYNPEKMILKEDLYEAYASFCDEYDLVVVDMREVGKRVPTIIKRVVGKKPVINGKQRGVWTGLDVKVGGTWEIPPYIECLALRS